MKSFLTYSFSLFLSLAVLASSNGVTVFKMVCGVSGEESSSLQQINDCCQNEKQDAESVEEECCDFSTQTFKVGLLFKTEFNAISFFLAPSNGYFIYLKKVPSKATASSIFCDSSPPKTGRQILCFNSVFIV